MKRLVRFYIFGAVIFIGAVIWNFLSPLLGMKTAYAVLANPSLMTVQDAVWVALLYPLFLGASAMLAEKILLQLKKRR